MTKALWCGAIMASSLVCVMKQALAFDYLTCGGQPIGIDAPTSISIDRCTAPSQSVQNLDFRAAVANWNAVRGMVDMFTATDKTNNCSANLQGNGTFDMQMVASATIGGAAGMAWYDGRLDGTCSHDEFDILMANDITTIIGGPGGSEFAQPLRRLLMVHELGHVMGMGHASSGLFSVMAPMAIGGLYGGRDRDGTLQAAFRAGPNPHDVAFGRSLFADSTTGVDPNASAYKRGSSGNVTLVGSGTVSPIGVVTGCSGQSYSYQFAYGNTGTSNIPSSSPVGMAIVLSADQTISRADAAQASWTFWANAGTHHIQSGTLTIPSWLTLNKTYYLGAVAEPNGNVTESNEHNNATMLPYQIIRTC